MGPHASQDLRSPSPIMAPGITHEQNIIICRQLFAGHAMASQPLKKEGKKCIQLQAVF